VRKDLQLLAYPERNWVRQLRHPASGQHVYDVIIVGGGQCGLTTAFGLSQEKVKPAQHQYYFRKDDSQMLAKQLVTLQCMNVALSMRHMAHTVWHTNYTILSTAAAAAAACCSASGD
jgi:succinate dehydrogenase/fumarate reductase flavoprotein subunit